MFVGLAMSSVSAFTPKKRVAESDSADPNLPVNAQLRAAKTGADDAFTSSQAPSLKQNAGDLISAESDMTSGLAATLSQKVANDLVCWSSDSTHRLKVVGKPGKIDGVRG